MNTLPPSIALLSPRSLAKYTSGILAKGFGALGYDVVPLADAQLVIATIDGTEVLERNTNSDSCDLLKMLVQFASAANPQSIVLTVRCSAGALPFVLSVVDTIFGCTHYNIPGFKALTVLSEDDTLICNHGIYIPHGFFSAAAPACAPGRVVVGTHCRPSEYIDTAVTLRSILGVLSGSVAGSVVGYLGGRHLGLSCERALEIARESHPNCDIEVVHNYGMVADAHRKRVLVVSADQWEPDEYCCTFDVRAIVEHSELSHLEGLSLRASIPVVSKAFARRYMPNRPAIHFDETPGDPTIQHLLEVITSQESKVVLASAERYAQEQTPVRIAKQYLDCLQIGAPLYRTYSRSRNHEH